MRHPLIDRIVYSRPGSYVVFYTRTCGYSRRALELLKRKKIPYKAYEIENINGGMSRLLNVLSYYRNVINYDVNHTTRPIIFYNGKFVGGFDQLSQRLESPQY